MLDTTHDPEHIYHQRVAHFTVERDEQQRRSDRNGNLSLVLLTSAVVVFGFWLWLVQLWLLVVAGTLALTFVASFLRHGDVNRALNRARVLVEINGEGLARLRRDWAHLPLHEPSPADPAHPYADDLDISGRASLEHLLHTPTTPVGQATLRAWLLAPTDVRTIERRQRAVAELAEALELRDDLALRGRLMAGAQRDYEQFLNWAEDPSWLLQRFWLIWLSRLFGAAAVALLIARLFGAQVGVPLALVLLANTALYFGFARVVELRITQATARSEVYGAYAALFARITTTTFQSPELLHLQAVLSAHGLRADQQMQRLARLMPLAQVRTWMLFLPIQLATLWSFHVLWLLERWQRDAGQSARTWLVALGEFEALAALATLRYDNPTWVFPELTKTPVLEAQGLGHPLLSPAARVGNDVAVGPPGNMLLVTGSNMSGKSTLLRAIGINAVLAQAGGPVCADALGMPPMIIVSSMRVRDSLEGGVSYFMAELQRLKFVVDLVAQTGIEGEQTPLFLLDEILHGTNSAERLVAARAILRHLLDLGAMGAVSTHDLALAETPDLLANSVLVHFEEQFSRGEDGPTMTFDYHLRPGVAVTTNAIKLMELLGLPVPNVTPNTR